MNPGSLLVITIMMAIVILLMIIIIKQMNMSRHAILNPSSQELNSMTDNLIVPLIERVAERFEDEISAIAKFTGAKKA